MRYAPEDEEEVPSLRRLRRMVMALMVVLMLAIVAIAATLVIRLGFGLGHGAVDAERFALPPGDVLSIGRGEGTVLFLVRAADGVETLYVFDSDDGGAPASATVIDRN